MQRTVAAFGRVGLPLLESLLSRDLGSMIAVKLLTLIK